jgi:hypothetical protein
LYTGSSTLVPEGATWLIARRCIHTVLAVLGGDFRRASLPLAGRTLPDARHECGQALIGSNSAAPLTAVYGLGQMLGPLMVAPVIGDSYGVAFTIAFVVLACDIALSVIIARKTLPRRSDWKAVGQFKHFGNR